jgi:hypothetical protein
MFLDYLDTVEVIGSIPVAPTFQVVNPRQISNEHYRVEIFQASVTQVVPVNLLV